MMKSPLPPFAGHVLVIGSARELADPAHAALHVERLGPAQLDRASVPLTLVFDAGSHSLELLEEVRSQPRFQGVPVLVLADRECDGAIDALGADDVLVRPVAQRELARRLRTLLKLGWAQLGAVTRESASLPPSDDRQRDLESRRFERLNALATLVAGFAHELRNPMASLRALTESLNDELSELNLCFPHVARMLRVVDRVERLVRTSLEFGCPRAPTRGYHRPWNILSAASATVSERVRTMGGDVRIEMEPELPDVYADDRQLVHVLSLLLQNALDATGVANRVALRAVGVCSTKERVNGERTRASAVRLEVRDDGPGIPPDQLARIFDPFFTTKPSAMGLGLSIVQQLVIENEGRLEVTSEAGHTIFAVVLPVRGMAQRG